MALLDAFITTDSNIAPKTLLLHGPPATGKSLSLLEKLKKSQVKYSWIRCDQCVTPKIMWKKIVQKVQVDSGKVSSTDLKYDALATGSFQAFLKQLQNFCQDQEYNELHYLVLDRADQIMEDGEDLFANFVKIQEVSGIENLSVIFVVNNLPSSLITISVPSIFFENYCLRDVIQILSKEPACHFSENLMVDDRVEQDFWNQYVKLIVEAYHSYTVNVMKLKNILMKLWQKFVEPIEKGELKTNEFLTLYRRNFKLIGSEYAVSSSLIDDIEQDNQFSHMPILSKYLLIAAYLASFNNPKHDWTLFATLKDVHKKKSLNRPPKTFKVNSRLLEPNGFDLERMFAITHALYAVDGIKLHADVDLMTQVANLSSMKLLLKSNNVDYISAKTKWKVNCSFEFIQGLAADLTFSIENYLIE
jgi:origin recognition complex subunit 5